MREKRRTAVRSLIVESLWIGVLALVAGTGLVQFVVWRPALWSQFMGILDARGWSHWTWTTVVGALLATLLLIRMWPERKA